MNPTKSQNTWAQAAGKGLNLNNSTTTASQNQGIQDSTNDGASGEENTTKVSGKDDELRQAITSLDGWGRVRIPYFLLK